MNNTEYLARKYSRDGITCPNDECDATAFDIVEPDEDVTSDIADSSGWVRLQCSVCLSTWTETYICSGFEDLVIPPLVE